MNHPAAPAYTLKGKRKYIDQLNDGHENCAPGPIYDPHYSTIKNKCPTFSTAHSNRYDIDRGVPKNPSPTHYNAIDLGSGPYAVFPNAPRTNQDKSQANPESTLYNPRLEFTKPAPSNFTMGSKYSGFMENTSSNPGPGYYQAKQDIPSSTLKSRHSKFHSSRRFSSPAARKSGVGDYNIDNKMRRACSSKGTIATAQRFSTPNDNPAPGAYDHGSQFENRKAGKTLGARLGGSIAINPETKNAYNNYMREDRPAMRKTFSFHREPRGGLATNKHPGPGEYANEKVRKNTARAFINTARTLDDDPDSKQRPGPGHYQNFTPLTTKYTFCKSKSASNLGYHPGVGSYNISDRSASRNAAWTVGKSKRTNFVDQNKAGVGDYQILQIKTGGVTIPKSKRFPEFNQSPGPPHYHIHSTLSNFNFYRKRK